MVDIPRGPDVPAWVTTAAINEARKREAEANRCTATLDGRASSSDSARLGRWVFYGACERPADHEGEHQVTVGWPR